jgi:hypothetical protein
VDLGTTFAVAYSVSACAKRESPMITRHASVRSTASATVIAALCASVAMPALATPFAFSTGSVTNQIAAATRPDTPGLFEIETGDDFLLNTSTQITSATFTGLILPGATGGTPSVNDVIVEIYRVFPNDSDVGRTSGPPTFETPNVPTRVNSPSDVAFDSRDFSAGNLSFSLSVLSPTFGALNSVQPGGIHPKPGQTTGGDGPVTGAEIEISVNFLTPFTLPADHYFFVPQVEVANGTFLWLSGSRPIDATGTPFAPDLQSWTRDDETIAPDWLRVGTDIVGGTTFNAAFTLSGVTVAAVPEPATLFMLAVALLACLYFSFRSRKNRR